MATKVFDAVARRHTGRLRQIVNSLREEGEFETTLFRWRQELRLAALLHDSGHSILSHTSERIYGKVGMLEKAADELSNLVGLEKKAGEVISFCLSQTESVAGLLQRAKKLVEAEIPDEPIAPSEPKAPALG